MMSYLLEYPWILATLIASIIWHAQTCRLSSSQHLALGMTDTYYLTSLNFHLHRSKSADFIQEMLWSKSKRQKYKLSTDVWKFHWSTITKYLYSVTFQHCLCHWCVRVCDWDYLCMSTLSERFTFTIVLFLYTLQTLPLLHTENNLLLFVCDYRRQLLTGILMSQHGRWKSRLEKTNQSDSLCFDSSLLGLLSLTEEAVFGVIWALAGSFIFFHSLWVKRERFHPWSVSSWHQTELNRFTFSYLYLLLQGLKAVMMSLDCHCSELWYQLWHESDLQLCS